MRSRGGRTRRARGHHVCRKTHHSKLSRCSGRTGRSKGTSRWIGSDRFGSQNCRYRRRRVACACRRGTGLPLPYRGRSQRSAGKQSVGHASAAPKTGRRWIGGRATQRRGEPAVENPAPGQIKPEDPKATNWQPAASAHTPVESFQALQDAHARLSAERYNTVTRFFEEVP